MCSGYSVFTHIYIPTQNTHIHVYTYAYIYIYISIYICVYIYVYIIYKDTQGHEACAGVARLWSESRYIFTHIYLKQNKTVKNARDS